ncbi:MAG: hypothetical protein ACI8S6_002853 [Myxococcota bacterium]|jgi:hypothetical protein
MVVWLIVSGCAPEPDQSNNTIPAEEAVVEQPEDPSAGTDPELPGEYIYEEEPDAGPSLSLGEIEESILDVLEVISWVDPAQLTESYDALRLGGDSACPNYYYRADDGDYYDYWSGSCTADGGTDFSGYAYSYLREPYSTGTYTYADHGYLQMYGALTSRLGESLDVSGSFYHQTYRYDTGEDWYGYAYLIGDVRWSAADAFDTWMAEEYSLNLTVNSYDYATGQRAIALKGSLSGVAGVVNSALFEEVYLYSASDCPIEPSGDISVRDSEGQWYLASFQGAPFSSAPVFPPDCDGCGQVYYRGELIGDVCPDFSSMLDWSTRPW